MPGFNLIRNSRVFFTTNVDSTGAPQASGYTTSNSQELSVLDGFTFSQGTNAETIAVSEAGLTPVRGQRSFNTALNAAEFSMSTYLRPYLSTTVKSDESVLWNSLMAAYPIGATAAAVSFTFTGALSVGYVAPRLTLTAATAVTNPAGVGSTPSSTVVTVGEVVVLKGAVGDGASMVNAPVRIVNRTATTLVVDFLTEPSITPTTANFGASGTLSLNRVAWNENAAVAADTLVGNVAYSEVTTGLSNLNQLVPFALIFTVDGVSYSVNNCALNQASIDFGLDGIATIAWSGSGTKLQQLASNVTYTASGNDWTLGGPLSGTIKGRTPDTTARYITNKLSSINITKNIGGTGAGNTDYALALTGGNITISNNIQYITPANLGVVNQPIGYFTGARSITGNVTAYLKTGTLNTAGLLSDILTTSQTSAETKFKLNIAVGGSSNAVRAELTINGASVQVPSVDAQQVMSTTINFTAQGTSTALGASATYDLENTNDLRVRYYSN